MRKKILILGAIFILSLGLGALYSNWKSPKPIRSKWGNPLLGCDGTKVDRLHILRTYQDKSSEDIALIKAIPEEVKDKPAVVTEVLAEWSMVSPIAVEAEASLAASLPLQICDLTDGRKYEGQESLADLGLDPPMTEVTVMSGEDKFTLRLGKKREKKTVIGAIHRDAGNKWEPYWIPNKIEFLTRLPVREFQNRRVLKMKADNVQLLRVKRKDGGFTLEREGEGWILKDGKGQSYKANSDADRFNNRVGSLLAVGWERVSFSSDECSKLRGAYTLELEGVAGRYEEIHFTLPQKVTEQKEKRMLACNSDRKSLFQVHADMEKYLLTPAQALVTK